MLDRMVAWTWMNGGVLEASVVEKKLVRRFRYGGFRLMVNLMSCGRLTDGFDVGVESTTVGFDSTVGRLVGGRGG